MAAPSFRQGDTLSLALRADGGTKVYTVHVMQTRRCADGTRYLLARVNGTSVYLWDAQLAKLLHTWQAPPTPEVAGATAMDA
jgi:hypothetical protein